MSNKSGNFKGEINVSEMKGDKMNELEKRIEALEKQLADMQKATSCDFQIKNNEIFIKEAVISEPLLSSLGQS